MSNVDPLTNAGTLLFTEAVKKDLARQVSEPLITPSMKGREWCALQKHRPFPCTFRNAFDKPLSTACHVFDQAGQVATRKNSKSFRTHRKSFHPQYPTTAPSSPLLLERLDATLAHLRDAEAASIRGLVDRPQSGARMNQGELDRRPAWNRELQVKYFP